MPPSWTQVLCRRKGVLAAFDQPGPRHKNVFRDPGAAAGSCPSPRIMISALAPLSLTNRIRVLSRARIPSSCARILPTSRSMMSTIAAWIAIFVA